MRFKVQRWVIAGLFLFGIFAVFLPGMEVSAKDNVHALLVTRGDYDSEYSNLTPGPENDGQNFGRVLNQAYGDALTVTRLEKKGAQTVAEVTKAIQTAFAGSDSGDINYFFYSGHGDVAGMWLGGDEFMDATALAKAFDGVKGTNFLVIDCCYSGSLLTRSAAPSTFTTRFIREFEAAVEQKQSRSAITNSNFHVMVAAADDQESQQGGLGPNWEQMGMFTAALSVGCGVDFTKAPVDEEFRYTAMADQNRDGNVTFEELYAYVTSALYSSDAKVYPEQDKTVFLAIGEDQIPDTAVTAVQAGSDADGTAYLEVEYQGAGDGILQGALYQCEVKEDLWDSLLMSIEPGVSDYPYGKFIQAGTWEFKAEAGVSKVELPLGTTSLAAGEYFLLVNEKEGNTGCYIFPLTLKSSGEPKLLEGLSVQAKESFSVAGEGTLEILADLGTSPYSNQYDCDASCEIRNQDGDVIRSFAAQKISMEFSGGSYRRFGRFQWDGKDNDGNLAGDGTYTVAVSVSYAGKTQTKSQAVQVKAGDVSGPVGIEGMEVQLSGTQFIYDGTAKCPEVVIAGLQAGKDYTVAYENNRNAGQGTVRIIGTGNYSGIIVRDFMILPMDISGLKAQAQLSGTQFAYDGTAKCPEVVIEGLQAGKDYTVAYENNRNAGRGTVRVTGTGNYSGTLAWDFTVLPMDLSGLEMEVQEQLSYTGKALRASVKVLYQSSALKEGVDYSLAYSDNKKPGYGKVTVQGTGNYTGQVTKQFKILPPKAKAQKASKKGASKWSLRWKKAAAADGYEIQYSVNKKFKKVVGHITVKGAKKKNAVVSVPKKNKKYYFRIRSYKKVNGKKLYSEFTVFP